MIVVLDSFSLTAWAALLPSPPTNVHIALPGALGIDAQPQSQTVIAGQSATFNVAVAGDAPLRYQWTFNGLNVGSDSSAYTRPNCQLADDRGLVRVTASNGSGSIQSSSANLAVNPNGTAYYVASAGSDSNTGLSTNSPWTLRKGISHLGPDVTVIMMPGAYSGPVTIYNITNGAAGHPATLKSQIKWGAVIANSPTYGIAVGFTPYVSYLVIDGLCVSTALTGDGVGLAGHHITLRNCWIVGNYLQGINSSNSGSSNNIIEYNLVEYNGIIAAGNPANIHYHGIYLSGPNNVVRNNVIRNNCAGFGLQYYTAIAGLAQSNTAIYNNLIYGHTNAYGLSLWGAVDGGALPGVNYIFGNTILDGVSLYYGTDYATNNLILPSMKYTSAPIYLGGKYPPILLSDYNMSTVAYTAPGAHDVITNYMGFVNPHNGLYWLKSDSPARGKALPNVTGPVDFFGNARPSVNDIGAFQYFAPLAADARVLDPSSANPDFWSFP